MFEFLFKYPFAAFSKGELLLAGRWPWLLPVVLGLAALALAWPMWKRRHSLQVKPVAIWLLQTAMVAVLLVLVWQPALSVATLRPQQNVVAVVVDHSKSMGLADDGAPRLASAVGAARNVSNELQSKFQVRLYGGGADVARVPTLDSLKPDAPSTRLGENLRQIASEAASLPVGAVVLFSDGADNAGGIDLPTIDELRRYRVPIHTVGFGRERPSRDIELLGADIPQRVLADSKIAAQVSLRQFGYEGRRVRLSLKDGDKSLGTREVALRGDGVEQNEAIPFNAGQAGVHTLQVAVEVLGNEENAKNNAVQRLISVDATKPRVLYIEGDPKWEYKFIRRAIELDQGLELVSMLRTTQNKVYRQGITKPDELAQGFPATVEELFGYQAIIIGGVEANYFTPTQHELLRQFVDRRGGGLLWLGARNGLADGGWGSAQTADLLPVSLPNRNDTFRRDLVSVELTANGRDSLLCRLDDDPQRNVERWKKLPQLANFQSVGTPKPGAVVLAEMQVARGREPLLVTQTYGRGRTAVLATSGTWRWQMSQPVEDMSHEMFWQQMLRWLVTGAGKPVISTLPRSIFSDEPRVPLRAEVRDKNYIPVSDARVEAHLMGPNGLSETVELRPDPMTTGLYTADWAAVPEGAYVAELVAWRNGEEAGRDVVSFRREDGVAENFRTQQNRELLEKLAQQTGGRYYRADEVGKLAKEIAYSDAGISVRETRDLWDAPIFFIGALMLRSAEWLLRRKWGIV